MDLSAALKKIPHLSTISSIARKQKVNIWLVGGFLRDIYLKKKKDLVDFDFCVEKNTFSVVKEFSKKISSKFIVLDAKAQSLRVILKKKNKIYTYDFTLMRGQDLCEDLSLRDFSINTLALNLRERKLKIIDYFKAREDLKKKVIRVTRDEVIPQDPLRILRGFSFRANYDFHIESKTYKLMTKHRRLLKRASRERVGEELFKILNSPESYKTINEMDKARIIDEVIPYVDQARGVSQGGYHHLGVWKHSLETLRQFELFYTRKLIKDKEIADYLHQELAVGRPRLQIVKLACLLHDIGKPTAKKKLNKKTIFHTHEKIGRDLAAKIADRLRISYKEKEVLKRFIFWHLRPGYLADQITPSKRAIYHFFRDTQEEGAGVILVSLSDWRSTRGPLVDQTKRKRHEKIMISLIDSYFEEKRKKPLPKIIDGYDIMRKFKLGSGSLVGEILHKIKEEQVLGKISTKQEALKIAKEIISK
jgi:poly(A) polymerase